jgi:hypothetical protein
MNPVKLNLKIYQGSTFNEVLRWESSKKKYKSITAITQAAPAIVTSTTHGVPDGWRVKITNVGGMTEINSADNYLQATVVTADSIELNAINAVGYKAYTQGGILEYNEPVDLTGYYARMQIREKLDSVEIIDELTSLGTTTGITIDTANCKITLNISATDTAAYTFSSAVYSLELVSSTGVVTPLLNGVITLVKEITR